MSDTDNDAGNGGADKTFTQADVDRIVQERVARAKTTPPDDYDDLKAKAEELDKLKAASQTELEKANARADKAEQDAKAATDRAKETSLKASVVAAAAKANIIDPDAAFALLDRTTLTLDADGAPTNAEEAVKTLLEAKPYLAAANGGRRGSADQGAREGGNGAAPTMNDLIRGAAGRET